MTFFLTKSDQLPRGRIKRPAIPKYIRAIVAGLKCQLLEKYNKLYKCCKKLHNYKGSFYSKKIVDFRFLTFEANNAAFLNCIFTRIWHTLQFFGTLIGFIFFTTARIFFGIPTCELNLFWMSKKRQKMAEKMLILSKNMYKFYKTFKERFTNLLRYSHWILRCSRWILRCC